MFNSDCGCTINMFTSYMLIYVAYINLTWWNYKIIELIAKLELNKII